jgi:hypothetical protein
MNIREASLAVMVIALCTLSTGCAVGRRTIALNVPVSAAAQEVKGTIAIAKVTDERHFENEPAQASTPSIDGDVNTASRDMLKTMIGRQRGGFGKALGDVALTPPANVETETQALITEGLRRRGYTVGANPRGDSVDVRTLDVRGHGREEGQMASDEHWQRAYALAYEDYLKNLDSSLADAGL